MNNELYRQILLEKQSELEERLEKTAKHLYRREEPYSADFAEQAVELENNEVVEHLDIKAKDELAQIRQSLIRLENGEYGLCDNCHDVINEERLKAIPYARLCIKCADSASA